MLCNHRCNMSSLPECGLYTGIFALCLNSGPHAAALPLTADYVTESLGSRHCFAIQVCATSKIFPCDIINLAFGRSARGGHQDAVILFEVILPDVISRGPIYNIFHSRGSCVDNTYDPAGTFLCGDIFVPSTLQSQSESYLGGNQGLIF